MRDVAEGGRADAGRGRHAVFISYRRADAKGYAGRLHDALSDRGWRVARDIHDLQPGAPFEEALGDLISEAQAMVVVIGPNWAGADPSGEGRRIDRPDDWVRLEVEAGLADPRMTVIPALVDGATMPARASLPDSLQPLASRHAVELRDVSWDFDLARLTSRLPPPHRGLRRWPAMGSAVAVVAFVAYAAYAAGLTPWGPRAEVFQVGPLVDSLVRITLDRRPADGIRDEHFAAAVTAGSTLTTVLLRLADSEAEDSMAAATMSALRAGSPISLTNYLDRRSHTDAEATVATWIRSGFGVRIFTAQSEPGASNPGLEVTLINTGTTEVDLTGWTINSRARGVSGPPDGAALSPWTKRLVPLPGAGSMAGAEDTVELRDPAGRLQHAVSVDSAGIRADLEWAPEPSSFSYTGPAREAFVPVFRQATGLFHDAARPDHSVVVAPPELAVNDTGGWYLPAGTRLSLQVDGQPCDPPPTSFGRRGWPGQERLQMEREAMRLAEDSLRANITPVVAAATRCLEQ